MSDLFENIIDSPINVLSENGCVDYYGVVLPLDQANLYLDNLLNNIEWKQDQAVIMGKVISTKRKAAWYGDEPFEYTYSNVTKNALPWTHELLVLKSLVEKACNEEFNSCLLNLYHNGMEGMGWHSDNEKDLHRNAAIASLSLGAEREFCFKHKHNKTKVGVVLKHGSLIVMKHETQKYWLHSLPVRKKIIDIRINLTFRKITRFQPV